MLQKRSRTLKYRSLYGNFEIGTHYDRFQSQVRFNNTARTNIPNLNTRTI